MHALSMGRQKPVRAGRAVLGGEGEPSFSRAFILVLEDQVVRSDSLNNSKDRALYLVD